MFFLNSASWMQFYIIVILVFRIYYFFLLHFMLKMSGKKVEIKSKGRSLDRQITAQDVDCLREAFALFDIDREEEITAVELGKVG